MPSPSGPQPAAPTRRPAAVLFDLDGTLIDSIDLILKSARHAFDKCGLAAPTDQEWLAGVGRPLPTMFRTFSAGDGEVEVLIAAYREFQMANHDVLLRGYQGVPEMLGTLAGHSHPMAIVTSKTTTLAARGLERMGIDSFFATIVGMDSSTRHKPHPEPVMIALDRLGYGPDEAWFVGDSIHDMESGNAAGVATIGALWGPFGVEDLRPSKPRYMAKRAEDVPGIVGSG